MELRALLLLLLCFPAITSVTEERRSEGSTLQILCPYNAQLDLHKKAWCRVRGDECELSGEMLDPTQHPYRTRITEGNIAIEDHARNRTVSITMTNLQVEDSGTYACAFHLYSRYHPLKAIVLRVFKELKKSELDRLSVQCSYSKLEYERDTKAWCRREEQDKCNPVARTDFSPTPRNIKDLAARSSIQDDTRNRTITITVEKLQAQDSGMYWCARYVAPAPTWIMEVSLSVSKSEYLWATAVDAGSLQPHLASCSNVNTFILISGILSVLFILALISLITLFVRRRKQKRRGNRQEEHTYSKPEDITQLHSSKGMESPKDDSKDLKYATLNFKPRPSPEDPLYCNIEPSQAPRKPQDESVEYAVIALK
ncbi:PIGR protein, partial [Centropus bengalensis]|nr:PIGR protein [Centropus bengalensis]